MTLSLAVLISGRGSNLLAMQRAIAGGQLDARVVVVIGNRPDVGGLQAAHELGLATAVLDHRRFASREDFDRRLAELLDSYHPQVVALAGFMRILTAYLINSYAGRLLNIHPSLLPLYPGLHTHQRALDAGDSQHGASVHFVTADLDGGPVIAQVRVPVQPGDDAETLAARLLPEEHRLYPMVLQWLAQGRLEYRDGAAYLDGAELTRPVQL